MLSGMVSKCKFPKAKFLYGQLRYLLPFVLFVQCTAPNDFYYIPILPCFAIKKDFVLFYIVFQMSVANGKLFFTLISSK